MVGDEEGADADADSFGTVANNIADDNVSVSDDDEVNMAAYNMGNMESNGLQRTEQAGVIHLVHRWIQRGHPN